MREAASYPAPDPARKKTSARRDPPGCTDWPLSSPSASPPALSTRGNDGSIAAARGRRGGMSSALRRSARHYTNQQSYRMHASVKGSHTRFFEPAIDLLGVKPPRVLQRLGHEHMLIPTTRPQRHFLQRVCSFIAVSESSGVHRATRGVAHPRRYHRPRAASRGLGVYLPVLGDEILHDCNDGEKRRY